MVCGGGGTRRRETGGAAVGGVVSAHHGQRALLEEVLLIATRVGLGTPAASPRERGGVARPTSVGRAEVGEVDEAIEAVVDLARRGEGGVLAPVVVGMLVVAEPGLIAAAQRGVLRGGHACIPLPNHMRTVPCVSQLPSEAGHVPRNAREAGDRILRVLDRYAGVPDVHVHRQPAALERGSSGRAELVRVVVF